jgi:hypothetical protein
MNIRISNPVIGYGVLTTEHPASSYGVPVLVLSGPLTSEPETVFGPGDLLATHWPPELLYLFGEHKTIGDALAAHYRSPYSLADQPERDAVNAWLAPIGVSL